ncbi:MAG: histidine kinase [Persephonella sp.]|nr:MAG: histidine kinase [Persephonella sp.]
MKIILLDEDQETYEVLQEVAKLSSSEIIQITTLEKAKELIDKGEDIDGIVAEKRVNNMPTWEILSYLKRIGKANEIPFIVLTKDITPEEKEFLDYMGVTAILEKPFNPLEVFMDIVEHLRQVKGEGYVKERLEGEEDLLKLKEKIQEEKGELPANKTDKSGGILEVLKKFIEFFKHLLGN